VKPTRLVPVSETGDIRCGLTAFPGSDTVELYCVDPTDNTEWVVLRLVKAAETGRYRLSLCSGASRFGGLFDLQASSGTGPVIQFTGDNQA